MADWSHRFTARQLFCSVCRCGGSIWWGVFPYCCLNVMLMAFIQWLARNDVRIAFSIQGHTLMTLLISYLVVAKINLSYDRYMKARFAIGNALTKLRELNQMALSYTFQGTAEKDQSVHKWRVQLTERLIDLMNSTMRAIRSETQAQYLARNEHDSPMPSDDPLLHVQALRLHLYHASAASKLQIVERTKLMDMLNEFVVSYRDLLVLASTPLPFPLLQMARTFLIIWTYSIPFVLRGVVEEAFVSYVFVFFLTYGFIGLELVSMKLVHPFGDGVNDLNVVGMREATLRGMERDLEMFGETLSVVGNRRLQFRDTKAVIPTLSQSLYMYDLKQDDKTTIRTVATGTAVDETTFLPDQTMYVSLSAV